MRRHFAVSGVAGTVALGGLLLYLAARGGADPIPNLQGDKGQIKELLPVKQVVLFNSGVGYFQREGHVDGNQRIELSFPVTDVNDLLKSLILQDLNGGNVSSVNFDSFDPIDKILHSFALDLNNNPTFGQILNQARGEEIEVVLLEKENNQSVKLKGTIVGMESKTETRAEGGATTAIEIEYLNFDGPKGLQAIPLNKVQAVHFLNPVLEREFKRALQVLATAHDVQKKTVSLGFNGAGKRQVRVGYVVERPIWKTTYRLRLEPNGKLFLQGWAVVDNPSDEDWNDVRMVLVSGKPISFKMNLYEPLYIPRPSVELEHLASLRPPVYSAALEGQQPGQPGQNANAQVGGNMGMMGMGGMNMMGMNGGFNGGFGQLGGQNFMPLNRYQQGQPQQDQANAMQQLAEQNKLTYEELQRRRQEQKEGREKAGKDGSAIAGLNFKEGISSVATADEIGDYYQYVIDDVINLPRRKSAMLPIINQTVDGVKVSIYNEDVHSRFPLLGLRLKNTSDVPLTQGPITVYEGSTYAGDTRTLDLQPGESRLISYALDQSTEIKTTTTTAQTPELSVKIGTDVLTEYYKIRQTRQYIIKNRSMHERKLVIEHPIRSDWKLVDAKPSEKTRSVYRFNVMAPAQETVKFEVIEEQEQTQQVALRAVDDGPPRFILSDSIEIQPVTKTTFGEDMQLKIAKNVLQARHNVQETRTYIISNHSDRERIFTVDHLVRAGWTHVGGADKDGPKVVRFKLTVPAGKNAQHDVAEEQIRTEAFELITKDEKPPRYLLGLGIEVQPVVNVTPAKLADLKIVKGVLQPRYTVRDETTYFVKNNADRDRRFQFDHLIRPDWKLLIEKGKTQDGPSIFRFDVKAAAGKTGSHELVEEKTSSDKVESLKVASEKTIRDFLADAAVTRDVKEALQSTLDMRQKLAQSEKQLKELERQLTALTDDQARLRENLKIIPPTADPYKEFLQKFVDQERQIDALQRQSRDLRATVQRQTEELDAFIGKLNAE